MPMKKGDNVIIEKNVKIGKNSVIEDFVVLGKPTKIGHEAKQSKIEDGAYFRTGTIVYEGTKIGKNFVSGDHARIRENTKIGNNVSIGANSNVERDCQIGDNVRVQTQCFIPEYTTLEENVWIGPSVVMTNVVHPPCPVFKEEGHKMELKCIRGPVLRKGAIVGAGSIILPGVEVGENSLIAAGSVVLDDVKKNTVVAGNPAKRVKKVKDLVCDPGIFEKGEIYSWRR